MIVAGLGFRAAVSEASLRAALAGLPAHLPPAALATAADKAVTPALQALAQDMGLPVIAIAAADLTAQQTPSQSRTSLAARGVGSVAEAAALVAAAQGGTGGGTGGTGGKQGQGAAVLLCPRVLSPDHMATAALAQTQELAR